MRNRSVTAALAAGFALVSSLVLVADSAVHARIRQEAIERSPILRTLHYLTDVYGPRVTGSPSLKAAGEWAVRTMESWGLTNGRLEPWDCGAPGLGQRAVLGTRPFAGPGSTRR